MGDEYESNCDAMPIPTWLKIAIPASITITLACIGFAFSLGQRVSAVEKQTEMALQWMSRIDAKIDRLLERK